MILDGDLPEIRHDAALYLYLHLWMSVSMCITLYLCWASHCHCQCSLFCDTGTWAWSPQSLQSLYSWTRGHDTLPGAVARGFNASFNCIKGAVQQCLVLGGDYQKSLDKWYSGGPLRWWKVVPFNWQYITNCVKSSTKYHVPSYAAPCLGRWGTIAITTPGHGGPHLTGL